MDSSDFFPATAAVSFSIKVGHRIPRELFRHVVDEIFDAALPRVCDQADCFRRHMKNS